MSDTYGDFDLTFLEPAVDKLQDVASWTLTHVQEVTDVLLATEALGTFTGTYAVGGGTWDYSATLHQYGPLVQITGTATRGTTTLAVGPNGEVSANLFLVAGVPLPLTATALSSGIQGTARACDFHVTTSSGNLLVNLSRAQPIGAIAIGETINFSGIYMAAA